MQRDRRSRRIVDVEKRRGSDRQASYGRTFTVVGLQIEVSIDFREWYSFRLRIRIRVANKAGADPMAMIN